MRTPGDGKPEPMATLWGRGSPYEAAWRVCWTNRSELGQVGRTIQLESENDFSDLNLEEMLQPEALQKRVQVKEVSLGVLQEDGARLLICGNW